MALTYEQRVERQKGIGGSDIAAILGLSRYASPLDIYNDKVGELTLDIGNEATNRGNLLEPIILHRYREQSGYSIDNELETFIHPRYPFLRANIDAVAGHISNGRIVEAKSVHMWAKMAKEFGEAGTDQIPTEYLVQCAFYAEVVENCERVDIPVAFVKDNTGTEESIDKFSIYNYERNLKLGSGIINKAIEFWESYVIPRVPPPGEGIRAKINPSIKAKVAEDYYTALVGQIRDYKSKIKSDSEFSKELQKEVEDYMEEFELLKDEDGAELVTRKRIITRRLIQSKLKAKYPEIYEECSEEVESYYFRILGDKE